MVLGPLQVNQSLTVRGSLTLLPSSMLVVNASNPIIVEGAAQVDGSLTVQLESRPSTASSVVTVVTAIAGVSGQFSSVMVVGPKADCESLSGDPFATPNSIQVTISLSSSGCPPPAGAIAGGVVGAFLLGFLIAFLIWYITRRQTQTVVKRMREKMEERRLEDAIRMRDNL